jgi:Fur family transcriptional regulator, ferric uptake regulator
MKKMSVPLKILQGHHLRVTDCRLEIISEFLDKNIALSHSDLEESLKENFDRVTIYRTLKTFLEKDLIHKVLDDGGATKYALCAHGESEHDHSHEHVHFKCEICGETTCLEDISLPQVRLPKGFEKKEMSLLVQGICDKCH